MSGRRAQVLEAAVDVLGTKGARGLTYQAVDTAAGVPAGTTSNCFRTREALIMGVVGHLEELDRADWASFAALPAPDADSMADALTGFVRHATGPARSRNAARYALFLEASSRPELRARLAAGRKTIIEWGAHWIRGLGSPSPAEHCRLVLDYLDGLILHEIALPGPDFDPAPSIRTVLGGLVRRET